jgi:hypothetical protein
MHGPDTGDSNRPFPWKHSLKNRTGNRTGRALGLGFYWSGHWFTGSLSGFLKYKIIYLLINAAINYELYICKTISNIKFYIRIQITKDAAS